MLKNDILDQYAGSFAVLVFYNSCFETKIALSFHFIDI